MATKNNLNVGNTEDKNSGVIELSINNDESRIIKFNPDDVNFAGRFYSFLEDFKNKQKEFDKRFKEIQKNKEVDEIGLPLNAKEHLKLISEECDYLNENIDYVFGEGTSNTVFGDTKSLGAYTDFLQGITPYIWKARGSKIKKYIAQNKGGVMR